MKLTHSFLAMALISGSALATQTETINVGVTAKIQTEEFQITVPNPTDDWINDGITLSRAAGATNLGSVTKSLYMKSTTGDIQAKLVSAASLTSGTNSIDLTVEVNGTTLSTTNAAVLTGADASAGKSVNFAVSASAAPVDGYAPGEYSGSINVIFETPAP